jgi:hypothetical protein
MFDSAFVTAARNRHAEGVISYDEMMQCVEGAQNREGMVRARRQLMSDPNMLGGFKDWDWEAIYQWFIDYFIPAMKVILPIIIMMLDTNPCPDED